MPPAAEPAPIEDRLDRPRLVRYLAARGFPDDPLLRKAAGIDFLGPIAARALLGMREDPHDKRLAIAYRFPGTDYVTVRWFGQYLGPFGTTVNRKTENPHGKPLRLYRSPLVDWDGWDGQTLYICESSLKALVLSHHAKVAAIAGSGVWGLCPKQALVDDWDDLLKAKKVIILFDNDWRKNRNVRASIRRLGSLVKQRWPDSEVVHGALGDPPTGSDYWDVARGIKDCGKWGIDDAIALLGWPEAAKLIEEKPIEPTERELAIDEFNAKYAVCEFPPGVIELDTGNIYTRGDFTGLLESHRVIWQDDRPVSVAKLWLAEPDRTQVKAITYSPGGDLIHDGKYNRWRDTGPLAVAGDVSEFLRVYENAIPEKSDRELLWDCFAYILQNRGQRLPKNFIFVGRQVGTGKSMLAAILATLLGRRNSVQITAADFASDFNAFFAEKELVVLDDIHRLGERDVARLKAYTTAERITVNTKNIRQYEVENSTIFIITTNEYASIAMDDVERRNVVIHFDPRIHYEGGTDWWNNFVIWLDSGGYGHLRHWFENRPLPEFDPNFMPPMTAIKAKMIASAREDLENWVADLYNATDSVLGHLKRSVFTTQELWLLYAGMPPTLAESRSLGRYLSRYFNQALKGRLVRAGGKPSRYWVVRPDAIAWDMGRVQEDIRKHAVGVGEINRI